MHEGAGRGAAIPRRGMLKALALAPVAVAGCAGQRAERTAPGADARSLPSAGASGTGAPGAALAQVRAFRVPADAEPAFVFRAAAARPGEPQRG